MFPSFHAASPFTRREGMVNTPTGNAGKENLRSAEKTTYRIGDRSFVVESIFKKESRDTLGSVLLRLMKAEAEKS